MAQAMYSTDDHIAHHPAMRATPTSMPHIRRSVSCLKLDEPLPGKSGEHVGEGDSNEFHGGDVTVVLTGQRAPMLRMPSPGPPISAGLSTILEADTSGISFDGVESIVPQHCIKPAACSSCRFRAEHSLGTSGWRPFISGGIVPTMQTAKRAETLLEETYELDVGMPQVFVEVVKMEGEGVEETRRGFRHDAFV
ncbi:hypothetical protein Hypma_002996 [Hypsizygus marmoreus]|uniref:Uncharacterized protein n=1 Tax=Hypsizygus marmoreus TaxID=39966 RepID=A0A369J976_HYPMA|nr:hypothetical protein Hypma_002996 [Hypsizygus marmoreus]